MVAIAVHASLPGSTRQSMPTCRSPSRCGSLCFGMDRRVKPGGDEEE
jgi:hypothetical protein